MTIDFAIRMFNYIMGIVQNFLWLTPEQFDANMWAKASGVQTALIPAAQTVLVIAFIASIYSEHLAEVNRSTMMRLALRFALAELLVNGCGFLIQAIAVFGNWLLTMANGKSAATISFTIPEDVAAAASASVLNIFIQPSVITLFRVVFELVFIVVCIGSGIIVLMSVIVRFFKLFIAVAIAPVPLAFSGAGSGNELSRTASRFIAGFIGLSVQVIVIWIVFTLYGMALHSSMFQFLPLDSSDDILYAWMINTTVHMLLLVTLTRGADKLVSQLGFS